jgi:hypothetical protein
MATRLVSKVYGKMLDKKNGVKTENKTAADQAARRLGGTVTKYETGAFEFCKKGSTYRVEYDPVMKLWCKNTGESIETDDYEKMKRFVE